MALLVFSIVYGRSSRKYFNSQRSKRKKLWFKQNYGALLIATNLYI
jgi:hypothetical protein